MSALGIGKNDVSEYTQALKDAISNKETENASLHNLLLKRDQEFKELKLSFDQTLNKLTHEADRAIRLEKDLSQCSRDLRQERISSQNADAALMAANNKLKAELLNSRDLQCAIDTLSHRNETSAATHQTMQKEKLKLEGRLRELEVMVQQFQMKESNDSTSRTTKQPTRPRSPSVADLGNTIIDQELKDTRVSLATAQVELQKTTNNFNRVQTELIHAENRANAMERRMKTRIVELESDLAEKVDELEFWKTQQGGNENNREEELLQRIEEDEAKITALEKAARIAAESGPTKTIQKEVAAAMELASANEARAAELAEQLDRVLDKLHDAQDQISRLSEAEHRYKAKPVASQDIDKMTMTCIVDSREDLPADGMADRLPELLGAIDRLRAERDMLKRNIDFLETESRFAVQAQDARLAEAEIKNAQAIETQRILTAKARHALFLERVVTGFAIVNQRLVSQSENARDRSLDVQTQLRMALGEAEASRANVLLQIAQLESRQHVLTDMQTQLLEAQSSLGIAESERDAVRLESVNLANDLALAQKTLSDQEERYATSQAQQITSTPSMQVNGSFKRQIQDLDDRVTRRTEQIGTLQHEVRRLQANMTLQDERVVEMAAELDTLAAEKQAMVEDCAFVREARDDALAQVETLELSLEATETSHEVELASLVAIIMDQVSRARSTTRVINIQHAENRNVANVAPISEMVVALALVRQALTTKTQRLASSEHSIQLLRSDIDGLREALDNETTRSDALQEGVDDLLQQHSPEDALPGNDLRSELADARQQLAQVTEELEDETRRRQDADRHLENVTSDFMRSIEALEEQLAEALKQSKNHDSIAKIRSDLEETHTKQLQILENELQAVLDEASVARKSLESRAHKDAIEAVARNEEYERKIAICASAQHAAEEALAECEAARVVDVEVAKVRLSALEDEVRDLRQTHSHEIGQLSDNLLKTEKECERLAVIEAEYRQKVEALESSLAVCNQELDSLQDEREQLVRQITELQTQMQKTNGINYAREREIIDSRNKIEDLKGSLEKATHELALAQKAAKAAEVTLSLQNTHRDRTVSELRRELDSLKSKPRLDDLVLEFQERIQSMDELLSVKCAEIEDNDDRIIQMLKEKKKLTAKVDTLTRRVQSLQSKIALTEDPAKVGVDNAGPPSSSERRSTIASTSKAFEASPIHPPVPPVPRVLANSSGSTLASTSKAINPVLVHPPIPPISRALASSSTRRDRLASGTALTARPQTPERRPPPPMVFKARTPDRKTSPATTIPPSASSSSSLSKKRRTPDDFDDIEVPLTARYVNADIENTTPRLRRVPSNVHSGFTPVRNSATRKSLAAPSPVKTVPARRVVTGHGIADITNSPRTDKSKRSWLGKIRGAPSKPEQLSALGYENRR